MNPYNSEEYKNEPIVKKNKIAASIHLNNVDPIKLQNWLNKTTKLLKKQSWENLQVSTEIHYSSNGIDEYEDGFDILIKGDRLESKKEFKSRINHIIFTWKKRYEQLLQDYMFLQSELGKAQIKELLKYSQQPIWNGYPESKKDFHTKLKEFRKQFE